MQICFSHEEKYKGNFNICDNVTFKIVLLIKEGVRNVFPLGRNIDKSSSG